MDVRTATPAVMPAAARPVTTADTPSLVARVSAGVAAAALLVIAIPQPVWEARLTAPQYPDGLALSAYGDRIEGDVAEITALNHYVGMRPYDPEDLPEMRLWVPTLLAAAVSCGIATVFGRRIWGRLSRLFVWSIPLGVLGVIQLRLYEYGHDLTTDPRPALNLEPFTPWVVGKTHVINFTTVAFPGTALLLIVLAAAVVSFGPSVPRISRGVARWMATPLRAGTAPEAGS